MENPKRYHGFLVLPRHSKLLLKDLGYLLFGFHLGLVMEAIWYRGNSQIGYVLKSQIELASLLNCDQATVSRNLNALQEKRYIIRHTKYKLIRLAYFPLFMSDVAGKMHSKDYANLNELYADMYRINAELQDKYAISQEKRAQKGGQSLYSSSKDDLGSFEDDRELIERSLE